MEIKASKYYPAHVIASYSKYFRIRVNKGMSDYEVANKAGVDYGILSRWKTGKATPTPKTVFKIANVLAVNVTDMLEFQNEVV